MLHRPMWDLGWFRDGETVHLPAGVTDAAARHLDLLRARRRGRADIRALTRPRDHRLVALPEYPSRS